MPICATSASIDNPNGNVCAASLFSITDVDETHPGLYEWDVQRLVTSVVPAARSLGLNEKQHSKSARRTVHADGEAMEEFASMPQITMGVTRL